SAVHLSSNGKLPLPPVDRERFAGYLSRLAAVLFWRRLRYTGLWFRRPAGRLRFLDRRPHKVPPLRPGAVVVPDVRVAEEVLQDEPRVRRPLPDTAVGDDLLVLGHALRFIEGLQLLRRLERAILVHGLCPRN